MAENPLDVARKHGNRIGGTIGSETFCELELSYASTLLPRFNDNPLIRTVQHLLLYRDQGYLKSTSIDEFTKCLPESCRVINVSSSSTEALFGSITDDGKHIVPPIFVGADFVKIDELTSFLGSSTQMKDKVNALNSIMEGAVVTRRLIKLSQEEFPLEKLDELLRQGIAYDPYEGQLSFRSDACFLAASRPIDNKSYTFLRASGHMYRFHILQSEISDEEAKRFFTEKTQPDLGLREKLKLLNTRLSEISVRSLSTASTPMMNRFFAGLQEIIQDEFKTQKKRLAEVIDLRTRGDILREIAGHAFLRTAYETDFHDIEKIEYTPEDEEFITRRLPHFVEFKVNPFFVEDFSAPRSRKRRPREIVKELVVEFLKAGLKQRKMIDAFINEHVKVSPATISNALSELLDSSVICQPRHGLYMLKKDCENCEHNNICENKETEVILP
jgi:hypothetical protein